MPEQPSTALIEEIESVLTPRDLIADVEDVFDTLCPREINRTVLDNRQVDMLRAIEALDDVFGEIYDPYAAEDGEL